MAKKAYKIARFFYLTKFSRRDIIIKLSDESKGGAKSSGKFFQKKIEKRLDKRTDM